MSTKRLSTLVVVIAAIVVAAATLSLTGAKTSRPSDDFAIRHPEGMPNAGSEAADLNVGAAADGLIPGSVDLAIISRSNAEVSSSSALVPGSLDLAVPAAKSIVTSDDFAIRHPGMSIAVSSIGTSDYFLRHPELVVTDTSDYFVRHSDLMRR